MSGNKAADAAIVDVSSVIRGILAEAERHDTLARHRVGEMLRGVKRSTDTYGTHAVDRVAAEIGVPARELYRHIAVAECWSEAELTALVRETTRFGQPLTWSHFLAIATAREHVSRAALLGECLKNAWSVRELTQRIDGLSAHRGRSRDAVRAGEAMLAAIKEGVQTAGRAVAELRTLEDALADRLDDADEPLDDAVLAHAEERFDELLARASSMLEQVRRARQSQTRLRCASPSGRKVKEGVDEGSEDSEEVAPAARRVGFRVKQR